MEKKSNRELVLLEDLFDFKYGISSNKVPRSSRRLTENHIHFIRPSHKQDTSIDSYVDKRLIPTKYVFPENTIYVATNGQGSHTYSYVSTEEFVPNSDVYVLIPKIPMSLEEKIFYTFCIKKNRFKFNYNRKPKGNRLKKLLVPKEIPSKWVEQINFESIEKTPEPADKRPTMSFDVEDWKYFELESIFNVKYGVNLELVNMKEVAENTKDTIRFVSRTAKNNGTTAFVERLATLKPNPGNTISVAGGGSVLATFYQQDEYYSGRDMYYLEPLEEIDGAALLFITTLIRREKYRFNYGRQANKSLKKLKIKLPHKDGKPDWRFMRNYINTLPFSSQI